MSGLSSDEQQLLEEIRNAADAMTGAHRREAARARLDALLAKDLTASLARLSTGIEHATRIIGEGLAGMSGELVRTRAQMTESSVAASRHQRALVRWTVILSLATIVYSVAALLPFFWRFPGTSTLAERAWVEWDWDAFPVPGGGVSPMMWRAGAGHQTLADCEKMRREISKGIDLARKEFEKRTGVKDSDPYVRASVCLPDTVDPRGPKGK